MSVSILVNAKSVQAAPLAIPPNLTLDGSCDTFGNSIFTIKNTGGAMTVNYTWNLFQNTVFLTSGPFSLTAAGTTGDTIQLSINGLFRNVTVTVRDNNGTDLLSKTVFCVERPTVRIKQAVGQSDPTTSSPIMFDVVFSAAVSGFTNSDVQITGMAATPGITVTDSGDHVRFSVAVTGMADGETVTATIPQDAAQDADGNGNWASSHIPADNKVTYHAPPNLTLDGSCDGFGNSIFTIKNTGGAMTVNYTWNLYQNTVFLTSGPFSLTKAGTTGDTIQLSINGLFGNVTVTVRDNNGTDLLSNTVFCVDPTPTVTIDQASTQSDPTKSSPIDFDVVFSAAVSGFTNSDVHITGMAGTPTITVTDSGDHIHFSVAVTGMADGETVRAAIPANVAFLPQHSSFKNKASTSTDNHVTYDISRPTVTINQAVGQSDPAHTSPIHFDVAFSEAITCFIKSDVKITGMHAAPNITVTDSGDHKDFTVAVTGMSNGETLTAAYSCQCSQ